MAGMPNKIVGRANEILSRLEEKHITDPADLEKSSGGQGKSKDEFLLANNNNRQIRQKLKQMPMQLSIFDTGDPKLLQIKEALQHLDLNALTPIELMMKVNEWKKMLE